MPEAFARAWLARAYPVGTRLDVHVSADDRISGIFEGIEPDGAMRLRLDDGRVETVRAGDAALANRPPEG
jgi:BirA family biotin operon repressor/biotin-[acetyl-CoA-carboxylase] ligase